VAVVVDRPQVVVSIRAAVGQRHDVVNLIGCSNPTEPDAFIAPAKVLVSLEDAFADAAPWPATTP